MVVKVKTVIVDVNVINLLLLQEAESQNTNYSKRENLKRTKIGRRRKN
jgi:hypothetical protein